MEAWSGDSNTPKPDLMSHVVGEIEKEFTMQNSCLFVCSLFSPVLFFRVRNSATVMPLFQIINAQELEESACTFGVCSKCLL